MFLARDLISSRVIPCHRAQARRSNALSQPVCEKKPDWDAAWKKVKQSLPSEFTLGAGQKDCSEICQALQKTGPELQ